MNYLHRGFCASAKWKEIVRRYALPWTLEQIDVGEEMLEIGPGYGAATEVLQQRAPHLTCVESDCKLTDRLRRKFQGNLTIRCEDATAMSFPDESFDSVVCFTMLHHIRSTELQNKLFAEAARVLRPGGVFVGTDSLESRLMSLIHLFDTLVLVDPETLPGRLTATGFENVKVDVNSYAFRFRAWKPKRSPAESR
jgi:SAM-dependent methyltransferase